MKPKAGDDQDVDLGVPEEPEQVLPEQDAALELGVEEMCTEETVEEQHHLGRGQDRKCDHHQETGDQHRPDHDRHAHELHALAAKTEDGDHQVDAGGHRTETTDQDAERPVVDVVASVEGTGGQGRIGEPAHVGCTGRTVESTGADERVVEKQPTEQEDPEPPGIQSGECHVPGADHQRGQVVAESKQHRHADQEDHGGAVHREHLVEGDRIDRGIGCIGKLVANHTGFDATHEEEQDPRGDVEDAQALVVDGDHPLVHTLEHARATGLWLGCRGSWKNGHRGSSP